MLCAIIKKIIIDRFIKRRKDMSNDTNSLLIIPVQNKECEKITTCSCGRQVCNPGHRYDEIREYYLIHYVESGEGIFVRGDEVYHVKKGQCFLILPYEHHYYQADNENPWTYMWIGFKGKIGERLEKLSSPVFNADGRIFREMMKANEYGDMFEDYLCGKIMEFMCNEFSSKPKLFYPDMAKNIIDVKYNAHLTIEQIALNIGVNKRYLSRIFKNEFGITMQQYIIKKRMSEATGFLKQGYSVSEVSRLVGYDDVFCFSRAFKKECGYAPSDVRKTNRNDGKHEYNF